MQLLHFSDTHNNRRAVQALSRVAAEWNSAYVAVTGDVCNCWWQKARPEFDELINPKVWFVRGNHDKYPSMQFGHLSRVEWQAPYLADLSNCVLVGLDSERKDGIGAQLRQIPIPSNVQDKKVIVALHHRPFNKAIKGAIATWSKSHFPNIVSIILLHGHEHHLWDFHAETNKASYEGINVITSHVYSANKRFRDGSVLGCANLFSVEEDGSVVAKKVYDSQGEYRYTRTETIIKRQRAAFMGVLWDVQVTTLAAELGVDPSVIINEAGHRGVKVKNPSEKIPYQVANRIREQLQSNRSKKH